MTRRLPDFGLLRQALLPSLLIVQTMLLAACANSVPATDRQVAQPSTVELGLTGRIHFNTQTSDFVRSRAF